MKKRTEFVVGVVILAAAVLVLGGTLWLQGGGFGGDWIELEARLHEVGQLQQGNAVKFRGVPIGRVGAIRLEPDGRGVRVMMNIEPDVPLPADPVVLAAPGSMFGDWHIEIIPREQLPHYAYAEAPDPGVLPGYALPDMSRLTVVVDRVATNLATLGERFELAFTEETAHNIRRVIDNVQEVSEKLTGMVGSQQQVIEEVARNLSETTEAMGEAAETLNRAFSQIEAAVSDGELSRIVENVENITARLDSLSTELLAASGEFRGTLARADHALESVGSIAEDFQDSRGTLHLLMNDSALYHDLVLTNALFQALIDDFRANPRKYIRLSIF